MPNTFGPPKSPFWAAVQKWRVHVKLTLDSKTLAYGMVVEQKFQTLTSWFVEMLCLTNSGNMGFPEAMFVT